MVARPRSRRSPAIHPLVFLIALATILFIPVLGTVAQSDPVRTSPTETPSDPGSFQAQPTEEPTREPERIPPTDEPEVPTEEPEPAAPSSLTLHKGACDDANFDPYTTTGLDSFLAACASPDGEFEFTVFNNVAFNTTQSTELGTLFMQLPTGPVTITETISDGWGDPAVFCWSNLFPTPSDTPYIGNSPVWDVAEGEGIECWWFNVSQPEQTEHTIRVEKRVCPEGFVIPEGDYWALANGCQEPLANIGFAMTVDVGANEQVTNATGQIEWIGVNLGASGQVQIDEDIPDGYGEPVVWCVNFPVEAADAQDFDFFQVESVDGLVFALPEQDAPFIFNCTYFNVIGDGVPEDLVDPGSVDDGDSNTVTVIKRACPMGVTEDADPFAYMELCPAAHDDVAFTLDHDGGSLPDFTVGGQVQWTGVPAGEFAIQETVPPGFVDPIVFCFSTEPVDGLVPLPELVTSTGGLVSGTFDGTSPGYECWWLNIAAATGTPASGDGPNTLLDPGLQEGQAEALDHDVTVTKRTCPAATDPTLTLDAYQNLCPTTPGIEFTLEYGAGSASTTTTDASGEISWLSVADGPFELRETNHVAYSQQLVFCHYDGVGAPWQAPVVNGAIQGAFDMGLAPGTGSVHLICDWVNIESDTTATLTVIKHRCPLGVPEDATLDQYLVICADLFDGVTFTLEHSGQSFPAETANGGQVVWTDVPAGPVTLVETNPGGYKDPRVFCHFFQGEQELLFGQEEFSLIGHIWLVIPHDATDVLCYVINIPNPDANSITVQKWLCPDGFNPETDDPYAECTDPMGGVTFTLGDMEAITGDDQGVAVFPGIPSGEHQLTEVMPDGISHGWIDICILNDGQGVIPLGGDGIPSIKLTVDTGDHWVCHIYNVPEGDEENSVTIRKWQCPEGAPLDQAREWYEANCLAHHDGVQFSIASSIGIAAAPTMGGAVQFDMLPAGDVGIQEQIPDGFGSPLVFCNVDGNWQTYPAPTGHWSHDFPDDNVSDTLNCYVFNIPGSPPDLTILKWTCPEGYDLHAWGADPHADCTEATNGIEFELRYSGHNDVEQSQVTGDVVNGGVLFENLQPDLYHLTEIVPAGIDSIFILECTGHIMGVLQPYPLATGNELDNLDLDAGEHLICHWFNVPEPDGGNLTIIKYTCATQEFVSEVDCQIEEDGVTFDLSFWTGTWDLVDTETTDGFGRIQWTGLDAGEYWFEEHDGEWCNIASELLYEDGPWVVVPAGQETVVKVYNCDGTPGIPGETPTKYPNTGTPRESGPIHLSGRGQGQHPLAA